MQTLEMPQIRQASRGGVGSRGRERQSDMGMYGGQFQLPATTKQSLNPIDTQICILVQDVNEPLTANASRITKHPLIEETSGSITNFGKTIINDQSELILNNVDESLYSVPT